MFINLYSYFRSVTTTQKVKYSWWDSGFNINYNIFLL